MDLCQELGLELKESGVNCELEDKSCPFCGHNDCFKIHPEENFFKCFSCDSKGDVIQFFKLYRELDSSFIAARQLANLFKIAIPEVSPLQEIYNAAAQYYHNALFMAGAKVSLGGMTPLQYQLEVRRHKEEGLRHFLVGWSDGNLWEFLSSLDISVETNYLLSKGRDFLPSNVFIYPHIVGGNVSHFTIKDPQKCVQYQLPNQAKLNEVLFYNQDSFGRDKKDLLIVEGENDVISLWEAGWQDGLFATNGSISKAQLKHISLLQQSGAHIITCFDNNKAGDVYRKKVKGTHLRAPEGTDVDEYLTKNGGTIAGLQKVEPDEPSPVEEPVDGSSPILVKNGAYYRRKIKDSVTYDSKISNFTMELRHVYLFMRGGKRHREIVFIREDGTCSEPTLIDSEVKNSLKSFKILVSEAVDGVFYGSEYDLVALWDFLYLKLPSKNVIVPSYVGYQESLGGFLFKNAYIDNNKVYLPDEEGIIWTEKMGIKPQSLTDDSESMDIPHLITDVSDSDTLELLQSFLRALSVNLGNVGQALVCVAWLWANCYYDEIFKRYRSFPLLLLWGEWSGGKSHIARWLSGFYSTPDSRFANVTNLTSGVGYMRKMEYYSSIPFVVDEVKKNKETELFTGKFKSWYDRVGRSLASSKDTFSVKDQAVRSTFLFVGEDTFSDPALKSRCIPLLIAKEGREMTETYATIESMKDDLPAIPFFWLKNKVSRTSIYEHVDAWDKRLKEKSPSAARTAKIWAVIAAFADQLVSYFPNFELEKFIIEAMEADTKNLVEENNLSKFLMAVEGLQVGEHPVITNEHIRTDGDKMYMWYAEVFSKVSERWREEISRDNIRSLLKNQPWFVEDNKLIAMRQNSVRRKAMVFDLTKAPQTLLNIAEMAKN